MQFTIWLVVAAFLIGAPALSRKPLERQTVELVFKACQGTSRVLPQM
jgi:hypothetical protein